MGDDNKELLKNLSILQQAILAIWEVSILYLNNGIH